MSDFITYANKLLRFLTRRTTSPTLPEYLFLLGTFFFPQVNVDLVVRINNSRVVFTWRDDLFGNTGWHLPGSIIRPNETFSARIQHCIRSELPFLANHSQDSIQYAGLSEVIGEDVPGIRSHFISHVYLIDYQLDNQVIKTLPSSVMLTNSIPEALIPNHERYKALILDCIAKRPITPEQYY